MEQDVGQTVGWTCREGAYQGESTVTGPITQYSLSLHFVVRTMHVNFHTHTNIYCSPGESMSDCGAYGGQPWGNRYQGSSLSAMEREHW